MPLQRKTDVDMDNPGEILTPNATGDLLDDQEVEQLGDDSEVAALTADEVLKRVRKSFAKGACSNKLRSKVFGRRARAKPRDEASAVSKAEVRATTDQAVAKLIADYGSLLSEGALVTSPNGRSGFFADARPQMTQEAFVQYVDGFLADTVKSTREEMLSEIKKGCSACSEPARFVGGNLSTPTDLLKCSCREPRVSALALRVLDAVNKAVESDPVIRSAVKHGVLDADSIAAAING